MPDLRKSVAIVGAATPLPSFPRRRESRKESTSA